MRQVLVATLFVIGATGCSSVPSPDVKLVSEAARPTYERLFASDASARCEGAHAIAKLRPTEEPTLQQLVRMLRDDATFEELDSNGHSWTFTPAECAAEALYEMGAPAVAHVIPLSRH